MTREWELGESGEGGCVDQSSINEQVIQRDTHILEGIDYILWSWVCTVGCGYVYVQQVLVDCMYACMRTCVIRSYRAIVTISDVSGSILPQCHDISFH